MIYILVVGLILILIGLFVWNTYNKVIDYKKKVTFNWSLIDIELKRKAEIIPNLTTLLKSQMKYEQEELTKLTKLRNQMMIAKVEDKIKANEDFKLMVNIIKEKYPELQSHKTYNKLLDEVSQIEKQVAYQRHFYNEMIMAYNRFIEKFPIT